MTTEPFLTTASHLVGGELVRSGSEQESTNPATDQILGSWWDAGEDVIDASIASAVDAFTSTNWRTDRELRARALWDLSIAIEDNLERLATAITMENGKPLAQARFELSIAAPKLRYFAGLALTDLGHAAQQPNGDVSMLLREPAGVAGVIVPWNSPVILAIRSIAPALAAGCTVTVKMPAQTALTNALFASVINGVASLPNGVINVFTEVGDAGAKRLVADEQVPVISYTGSTAVGSRIAAAAGAALKRTSLELGGKTPMVLFADADLDTAIPTLTAGMVTFAGQFCMTGSRILVDEGIADEVQERLIKSLTAVQVGDGMNDGTDMGPMIDHASVERLQANLDQETAASVLLGGGATDGPGSFFRPALVGVDDLASSLIQNELFGPVATFERFGSEDEAVARANATQYGLSASVWTSDGGRALRVSSAIDAGTVWTNGWAQIFDQFEEGGYKKSGVGRLNGPGGLAEFQEVKHVFRSATSARTGKE